VRAEGLLWVHYQAATAGIAGALKQDGMQQHLLMLPTHQLQQ
jgi:hypothetical protein